VIEFDENKIPTSRAASEHRSRLIEESCSRRTAPWQVIYSGGEIAALHRVHEKPDAKKVLEFERAGRGVRLFPGVRICTNAKLRCGTTRACTAKRGKPDSQVNGVNEG